MVKKLLWVIFLYALFGAPQVWAQHPAVPVVRKAVYFDVSPPLRNRLKMPSKKADHSWKSGVFPNFINSCGINDHPVLGINDTVIQTWHGGIFPDSMVRNFDGLGNVNNVVPPDTHGDTGPSHYFHLVNDSWAIFDKTGARLTGPFNTSSIWEGMPNNANSGDGIVLYDEEADRWMISQLSLPSFPQGPFYQMIAVSQTPDPTGSWYRWEYAFGDLPDYPKFGVWPDGYYMSCVLLKSQTLQWGGVAAIVFDRNSMIAGDPAPASIQISLTTTDSPRSFLPADCDGPFPPAGTPNYFCYTANGNFVIREFHANWANPVASTFGNILKLPVSQYVGCTGGIPQKNSDKLLTPIDDRLMYRLQYRTFPDHQAMVVNHTVGVGSHAGIRWYEFRKTNGNWFVNQQSTYSPDTLSRWMGSIAMDPAGNMALGYSVSGTALFPSIRFTGRMNHDPPGQMTIHETSIMEGTGSQTGIWSDLARWGDYSTMTVDPAAPSTFWYAQEYYATTSFNGWKTRIASFSFAGILDIQATSLPSPVCAGGTARLDVDVLGGTGTNSFLWKSDPAGFTSDVKNPLISPSLSATYIVQVTSDSQVKTDSVLVPVIPLAVVFAGNDTTICRHVAELPLAGSASNCNAVSWFTSGDGYFTEPAALNTIYRPGFNDKLSASLILKLTAFTAIPCLPVSATRVVAIDTCTGMNEVPGNSFLVSLHPNPVRDKLVVDIMDVEDGEMTFMVTNMLDEILVVEKIESGRNTTTKQIDVSGLSKGYYLLRVHTKSRAVVRPFIIQ